MKSADFTTEVPIDSDADGRRRKRRGPALSLGLCVAWSADEPERIGEVVLVPGSRPRIFGRGSSSDPDRAALVRQRPGRNLPAPSLKARRVSRRQLRLQAMRGDKLLVECIGRCPLRVRGERVAQTVVAPGDLIEIEDQLLFLCVQRPSDLPPLRSWDEEPLHDFGGPDRCGIVGESPIVWQLRDLAGFVAPRPGHVLVLGQSGTGKELVARAIHQLSPRRSHPLVSRNAATIPASLMDAELFGHTKNYPNPGMPERLGMVGQADASTLFLDEIGELPDALQAHLLRLMDRGEYQRLGESLPRVSDLRLVGATNRPHDALKEDFGARFRHVIRLPELAERREDIPLLVRHLLRQAAADDPQLGRRFFDEAGAAGEPRVAVELIDALLRHPLPLQVRQLDALLWQCLAGSHGDVVELVEGVEVPLEPQVAPEDTVDPRELTPESIRACLDKHDWVQERVWRELGLQTRYQLRRLIKKHGIEREAGADDTEG